MNTDQRTDFTPMKIPDDADSARIREIKRYNKRMEKNARWSRPLITRFDTIRAYLNMWFSDHGMFRELYVNFHHVTPDVWRSAQPAPRHISKWHQHGLKTIITLRGGRGFGAWPLEERTAKELGITLAEATLRSRDVPDISDLDHFLNLLKTCEKPVLIHCKSGADRAGLAAALTLMELENTDPKKACQQLSLKYGHIKSAKTGILDHMLTLYAADQDQAPQSFRDWLNNDGDFDAQKQRIKSSFRPKGMASWLVDVILRRE